jgi:hypothetical protein
LVKFVVVDDDDDETFLFPRISRHGFSNNWSINSERNRVSNSERSSFNCLSISDKALIKRNSWCSFAFINNNDAWIYKCLFK